RDPAFDCIAGAGRSGALLLGFALGLFGRLFEVLVLHIGERDELLFLVVVVATGEVLAGGLALGFLGRAGYVHRDGDAHLAVQLKGDFVQADQLDRSGQIDLTALDLLTIGDQRLGDVAGRHRAVELAGFGGLADDDDRLALEVGGDLLGFRAAFGIAGLDRLALGLEPGAIGGIGAQCLALGQEVVAGIAVADRDLVSDTASSADAFEKDDFHACLRCCPVWTNG